MSFRNLFGPKRDPHTGLAADQAAVLSPAAAYDERLVEERLTRPEREVGYRRGRADQKEVDRKHAKRGGGFGFISFLLLIAAVIGVTWVVLAYQAGSFAGGGAVVDRKVAEVTNPAKQAVLNAADRTGAAVQSAGQAVEAQGSKLRQKAD